MVVTVEVDQTHLLGKDSKNCDIERTWRKKGFLQSERWEIREGMCFFVLFFSSHVKYAYYFDSTFVCTSLPSHLDVTLYPS